MGVLYLTERKPNETVSGTGRREEMIATLEGVREYAEGFPVELWRDGKNGRLVIRAWNEAQCNCTDVDLWDLMDWLSSGPQVIVPSASEPLDGAKWKRSFKK